MKFIGMMAKLANTTQNQQQKHGNNIQGKR